MRAIGWLYQWAKRKHARMWLWWHRNDSLPEPLSGEDVARLLEKYGRRP